ncbi:hypothetical protein AAG570_007499, partial [Ranatra chinensis]
QAKKPPFKCETNNTELGDPVEEDLKVPTQRQTENPPQFYDDIEETYDDHFLDIGAVQEEELNLTEKSELPYIDLPIKNVVLKCLIDSGNTKSYILPSIAKKHFQNGIFPDAFTVSTAHGSSQKNFSVLIQTP